MQGKGKKRLHACLPLRGKMIVIFWMTMFVVVFT